MPKPLPKVPHIESPIVLRAELLTTVPHSMSTIDRLEAGGQFPRRVRLLPTSRVGWLRREVAAYLRRLAKRRQSADVLIGATLGTTTKQKTLTVQVVSVTISPPALSMFSGQTQQFNATVSGATDPSVTWSLQEGANAGSINSSGFYVAPAVAAATVFHVKAVSVADNTKSATATVQVSPKPKEKEKDKEKEHKDKDKDHKDKDKDSKDKELHHLEVMSEPGSPILLQDEAMLTAGGNPGAGRAFIRAAERPPTAPLNGTPTL